MAPSDHHAGGVPASTFLAPTTDNRGMPQRKTPQYHHPLSPYGIRQATGVNESHTRLLTVEEALQFSPLSSVVPFNPGWCLLCILTVYANLLKSKLMRQVIIPSLIANIPSSQPIFSSPSEQHAARQHVQLLDRELTQGQRESGLAQLALKSIKPYLDQDSITNL
jgi:hypothetical protein